MATPTIEAISTQDITIDTDYALEIGLPTIPKKLRLAGFWKGFITLGMPIPTP